MSAAMNAYYLLDDGEDQPEYWVEFELPENYPAEAAHAFGTRKKIRVKDHDIDAFLNRVWTALPKGTKIVRLERYLE